MTASSVLAEVPTFGTGGIVPRDNIRIATPSDMMGACIEALDVSDRTRAIYTRNLGYYSDWLASEGRTGEYRADFVAYKNHLKDRYAASTVSAYMSAVRVFYQWLASEGLGIDITTGIKGPAKPRGFRKDPLSIDQARALLHVGEGDPDALRDRALTSLLIHTGIRTIEASRADVGDVRNIAGHTVLFVQGKGHDEKDEFVILTASTLQALNAYIASRGRPELSAPLFASESNRNAGGRLTTRSISRIVKARMKEAGIESERITAHSLRHTAVTLALLAGATVQEAQAMARHSSINTTMIYAHNIDRLETPAEGRIEDLLS